MKTLSILFVLLALSFFYSNSYSQDTVFSLAKVYVITPTSLQIIDPANNDPTGMFILKTNSTHFKKTKEPGLGSYHVYITFSSDHVADCPFYNTERVKRDELYGFLVYRWR